MVDDTIIYDDDWMSFESLYLGNAMHIYEDDGSFSPKLLIVPVQTWYDWNAKPIPALQIQRLSIFECSQDSITVSKCYFS